MNNSYNIIMLGATGAVGGEALKTLLTMKGISKISLLGRRAIDDLTKSFIHQHKIDIFDPSTYESIVAGHDTAICTLGVGEPSKASKEDFIKIDKTAVYDFAKSCKDAGVKHFSLLASVGINAESKSFYLRTKGELVEELKALNFHRLSIFEPSMILTPTNRYGFSQWLTLKIWPIISPLLAGSAKKYRGIKVEDLGTSIAINITKEHQGIEHLTWSDFHNIIGK